jgi:hypothetical protein
MEEYLEYSEYFRRLMEQVGKDIRHISAVESARGPVQVVPRESRLRLVIGKNQVQTENLHLSTLSERRAT